MTREPARSAFCAWERELQQLPHMYLSAFLHRDELFEITNRWLCDEYKSADPLQITRIITYDSFAGWEVLLHLTKSVAGGIVRQKSARTKG